MIRVVPHDGKPMEERKLTLEVVTDPAHIAEVRKVSEQAERNMDWLQDHWPDLLPQAYGKYLAVAGQEAFLADSVEEAIGRARAAHPEDAGLLIHYITPDNGPRIYANRG